MTPAPILESGWSLVDLNYRTAKGWLTVGERDLLVQLARATPRDGAILNVGIEYGASLACLRAGNPSARLVAIDVIGGAKLHGEPGAEILTADSGVVARTWKEALHLVFVDGDHGYQGVTTDCAFALHIAPGGVMAFHDCYALGPGKQPHPLCPDVDRAVGDWHATAEGWDEIGGADSIRAFRRRT